MAEFVELIQGDVFVDRYEIHRPLGSGDRKRTYLALDRKYNREVALSIVKPDAVPLDPEGTEREGKVLGSIGSHDNIVTLYKYDIESNPQYIVFEYLAGGTLAEYLQKAGELPPETIYRLARQVCRGLSHLHERGLIHRDVSPSNIWLDGRDNAHLGDFDSAIPFPGTETRRPVTTNAFAAPEEIAGEPLDVRSDLYSVGGVLYCLATGMGRVELLERVRERRDLPTSYGDLVEALLANDPEFRPANAGAVLQWLQDVRQASNLPALIVAGESDKVERKASLHHGHDELPLKLQNLLKEGKITDAGAKGEVKRLLNWEVTKSIAAFLNSEGGTVLVGIRDKGEALGIEADYEYCQRGKHDSDGWLLSLQEAVNNALDTDAWGAIRASVSDYKGVPIGVVICPRRPVETWHEWEGREVFYFRAANGTKELEGSSLVKYIREHWGR